MSHEGTICKRRWVTCRRYFELRTNLTPLCPVVRTLFGALALCYWARHFTLIVPLSTQVYKWVPVNLMLGRRGGGGGGGEPCDGLASHPWENKNTHKLWPDEPLGSTAGFTFLIFDDSLSPYTGINYRTVSSIA